MPKLRLGSRGSQLALWQANHISALLRARGHAIEIEIIHTTGDKITDVALAKVGTKGMFTKEIEEALAAGRVDLAVHSLKDLPTELPQGFEIAAITKREDPRDAFCSLKYADIEDLPQGARVGTSSLRRQAQLKAIRPDLDIHPLRGNVDTRLRKLEQGEYDAIILASAGLRRLGKTELVKQIIPAEIMCPAAGQGALGVEIRAGDAATRDLLQFLDDPAARAATTCERALLNRLGGGCQVPIGAFAEVSAAGAVAGAQGNTGNWHDQEGHEFTRAEKNAGNEAASAAEVRLHLESIVADPDGTRVLRDSRDGDNPEKLGDAAGASLLARGGDEILAAVYGRGLAAPPQP
ncbi:MAG TPA: hydroxymethylbilane synthase [Candidatus Sulfotelmatobacter sp.]|nr:hydroxymethylbilane synthase [Candidatus Sulfotelmatobacter sp.]